MLKTGADFRGADPCWAAETVMKSSEAIFSVMKPYWPTLVKSGLNVNARLRGEGTLMHHMFHIPSSVTYLLSRVSTSLVTIGM